MGHDGWRLGHRRGLDQLRGASVLLVVWAHAFTTGPFRFTGAVGVGVFFTLSGFLITRLLIEERDRTGRISLRRFYARRVRRLVPALCAGTLLAAVVTTILGVPVVRPLIASLTYTFNYFTVGRSTSAFSHLWSLSVEEHFYLVWPVVVALVGRRGLIPIALSVSALSASARVLTATPDEAYHLTHFRLDALLIGAVGAVVVHRGWRPGRPLMVVSATALIGLSATPMYEHLVGWGATVVAIASLVLVFGLLDTDIARPSLERIGVISYGIYLYHYPMSLWAREATDWPPTVVLAFLVLSIPLAELSYRFFEEPIRSWGRSGARAASGRSHPAEQPAAT